MRTQQQIIGVRVDRRWPEKISPFKLQEAIQNICGNFSGMEPEM